MYNRRLVLTFGLLTGLFAAGYGVMFTLLDDFRDRYGISESSLGMVVAVGFFAAFAAQVFFAPLADRGYARRLVNVGMVFNVGGLLMMAFGKTLVVLLLGRLVMGIGAGIAVPAIRRIVILADPENLGSNIGRLLAADVGGFAIGPAISAVLVGPVGIAAPFLVIAVTTLACFPVIARARVDETSAEDQPTARFAFDLLRSRTYLGALLFGSAVFLMVGTFDALWTLVLDDLRTADWIANLGITLFALPLIFLGSIGGRLAQRVGPFRVATFGLLFGACFMFSYGRLPTGLAMFCVAMVHALNDGVSVASSGVAVGVVAPKERMAGAQGLLGGAQTLVGGIAALIAGELYQSHGRATAYTVCAVLMTAFVGLGIFFVGSAWGARPVVDDDAVAVVPALVHEA
ncbi:MAG: putative major facilitator superfamily transporter [Ilumatobacteraceae bacterium]|nr:putative major facilitator superfamily transporter [Ilumatobacteraceae bacterium]